MVNSKHAVPGVRPQDEDGIDYLHRRLHNDRQNLGIRSEKSMVSLSRQLPQRVVGLHYNDLPRSVVHRAKGVTLHSLASVLLGSQAPGGQQAVLLITVEESVVGQGATIMVHGVTVTKGGAAFTNAKMSPWRAASWIPFVYSPTQAPAYS